MDDIKLLELLRDLEWSGDEIGIVGTCPICEQPQTRLHSEICDMSAAIRCFEERVANPVVSLDAAWNAQDFGHGTVIAVPTEPRIWGIWNKNMRGWLGNTMDEVVHSQFRQVMVAKLAYHQPSDDYEIREIGPDGLPLTVEP